MYASYITTTMYKQLKREEIIRMSSYNDDSDTGYDSLLEMSGEDASVTSKPSSTRVVIGNIERNDDRDFEMLETSSILLSEHNVDAKEVNAVYNNFLSTGSAETILVNGDDNAPDEDLLNETLLTIAKSLTGEISNVYRSMKDNLLAGESERNASKDRLHHAAISQKNDEIHSLLEEISMVKHRLTSQLSFTERVIEFSSHRMKEKV